MRIKKCCFFFFFFFTSTSRDDYTNPTPNFIARSLDFYVEACQKTLVFKLLSGLQSFLTESCYSYFFLSQSPSNVILQYIPLNTTLSNTRARETFTVLARSVPFSERECTRMFTFSPRVRTPSTSFTQLPRGSFCEIDAHWISFGRVTDLRAQLRNHVKALQFAMSNLDMSTYE